MTKVFGGAETTSHNTWDDLIGLYAEVTAAIDVGKPGLISFTVAGARQTSKAVSNEEEIIPRGASVRIRKIENHTAIVTPVNEKDGVKFQ